MWDSVTGSETELQAAANLQAASAGIVAEAMRGSPSLPQISNPVATVPSLPWGAGAKQTAAPTAAPQTSSPQPPVPVEGAEQAAPAADRLDGLTEKEKAALMKVQLREEAKNQKLVEKDRERIEGQARKERAAAERKQETERIKNLNTSKAARWSTGLLKDIGAADDIARDVMAETRIGENMRKDFKDKFEDWSKRLQSLKAQMQTCTDQDQAEQLLQSAPQEVKSFHLAVKDYRKASTLCLGT